MINDSLFLSFSLSFVPRSIVDPKPMHLQTQVKQIHVLTYCLRGESVLIVRVCGACACVCGACAFMCMWEACVDAWNWECQFSLAFLYNNPPPRACMAIHIHRYLQKSDLRWTERKDDFLPMSVSSSYSFSLLPPQTYSLSNMLEMNTWMQRQHVRQNENPSVCFSCPLVFSLSPNSGLDEHHVRQLWQHPGNTKWCNCLSSPALWIHITVTFIYIHGTSTTNLKDFSIPSVCSRFLRGKYGKNYPCVGWLKAPARWSSAHN